MTTTTLDQFSTGDTLKITEINDIKLAKRLLGYSICVGSVIEFKEVAPLGDPLVISCRTADIAIRKIDSQKVVCTLWKK